MFNIDIINLWFFSFFDVIYFIKVILLKFVFLILWVKVFIVNFIEDSLKIVNIVNLINFLSLILFVFIYIEFCFCEIYI